MEGMVAPFVVPGYEPSPTGEPKTPEERSEILRSIKQMRLVQAGIESPVAKAALSGGMGESCSRPCRNSSSRTFSQHLRSGV